MTLTYLELALTCVAFCVAYANGANDNFKGVATLFGSGTTRYRRALFWATATTLAGSVAALFVARELVVRFTGRGLVSDALAAEPRFATSAAIAAGLTVFWATRIGMPISTTHALLGGLVGAAFFAGPIVYGQLGTSFVIPLAFSPLVAMGTAIGAYLVFHRARLRLGVTEETCLCLGQETLEIVASPCDAAVLQRAQAMTARIGSVVTCRQRYGGRVLGVNAEQALDFAHFLSAGAVSFARGLNDTPKIAALLLLVPEIEMTSAIVLVGLVMAVGGLVSAYRVADTMSRHITPMNPGQGFTANLVTSTVVIGATALGLPVSTTHVSCGALFGIGTVRGDAEWRTIGKILAAWIVTLPTAAILAALTFTLLPRP
jgi:PiT family inorganic phosphate transporter